MNDNTSCHHYYFWLNAFVAAPPLSQPGSGLTNNKGPRHLILRTAVEYKKVFRLQPGEYAQVHQEDEPQNTINID